MEKRTLYEMACDVPCTFTETERLYACVTEKRRESPPHGGDSEISHPRFRSVSAPGLTRTPRLGLPDTDSGSLTRMPETATDSDPGACASESARPGPHSPDSSPSARNMACRLACGREYTRV